MCGLHGASPTSTHPSTPHHLVPSLRLLILTPNPSTTILGTQISPPPIGPYPKLLGNLPTARLYVLHETKNPNREVLPRDTSRVPIGHEITNHHVCTAIPQVPRKICMPPFPLCHFSPANHPIPPCFHSASLLLCICLSRPTPPLTPPDRLQGRQGPLSVIAQPCAPFPRLTLALEGSWNKKKARQKDA